MFEGKIEKKMKEIKTKKKKIEKRVKKHKQAKAELTKRTEKLEEHKKLVEEARTKYNEKTANIETSLEKLEKASPEEKVEALKKLGESIISKKANKLTRVLENKSLKPEQIAKITKKLTEMAEKKKGKNKTKLEKYNQKSGLKTEKLSEKIKLSNAEKEIQDKKLEEAKQNSANNKIDLNKKLEKYSEKANTKTGQTGEYNKAMVDVVKALQENPNLNNAALLARGKDLKGSAKAKFEKKIKLVKARVKHLKVIEEAHKLTEPSKKPGKELVEGKELLEESASNSTETIEHETKEKAERKAREKREDIKKLNEPLEKQNIYDKKTIDDYTTDIEKSKEIIKNTELKNEDIIKEYGKLETEIKELNTKRMSMSLNTPEIRLEHDLLLGEINAKKHKLENMDFSLQHNIENINSEDKRIGEKSAIIKELTKQIEKNEKTIYENEATISENTKPVAEEASAVETVETEKPANVVEVKAEESTAESTVKSKANVEIKAKLPKDPKDIKDEDVVKYLENSEKIFENKERNQIETDVKNFTLEKLKEYDETLSSNQKELEKLESKESKTEDDIKKIEELKEEIEELKEEKKTHLKIVKENMIYLEKINEIKKLPEKDRQKEMKLLLEEGVGTSFKHEYQTNKLRLSHEIEDLEIKSKKIIESKTAIIVEFEELKAESKQIIEQIDKEKNTEIKAILFNKLLKLTNNMDVKLQLVVEYKNKYEENSVQLDLKEEAQQNLESNHIDTITAIKLMENTYGQQIDSNSKLEDASDDFQEYKKNLKQKADVAGKKALDVVGEALSGEGVAGAAVNVALGSTGLGATVKTGERVLNAVGKEASVVVGKGITNTNPIKSSTKQNVENVENVKNVKNVENKKFNEDTKNGYNFVEGSRNVFEKDGKFYGKYTEGKTTHYFEVTKSKNGLNQDEYNLTPNGNKLRVEMVNRLIATESPATKNYEVRAIGSPTASTRTTEPEPEPTKNRGQFNGKNLKQINFFSNGEQLFEGNSFNTAVNATGQKYKKNQGDQTYYPI